MAYKIFELKRLIRGCSNICDPKYDACKFKFIKKIMSISKTNIFFDDEIITYLTKMLFENGIVLISQDAWNLNQTQNDLFNIKYPNTSDSAALSKMSYSNPQIQVDYLIKKINRSDYKWEHMVPFAVILQIVKDLCKNGTFNINKYREIKKYLGYVCIVTNNENKSLNNINPISPNSKFCKSCIYPGVELSLAKNMPPCLSLSNLSWNGDTMVWTDSTDKNIVNDIYLYRYKCRGIALH